MSFTYSFVGRNNMPNRNMADINGRFFSDGSIFVLHLLLSKGDFSIWKLQTSRGGCLYICEMSLSVAAFLMCFLKPVQKMPQRNVKILTLMEIYFTKRIRLTSEGSCCSIFRSNKKGKMCLQNCSSYIYSVVHDDSQEYKLSTTLSTLIHVLLNFKAGQYISVKSISKLQLSFQIRHEHYQQ